jgi:hypothetical protein
MHASQWDIDGQAKPERYKRTVRWSAQRILVENRFAGMQSAESGRLHDAPATILTLTEVLPDQLVLLFFALQTYCLPRSDTTRKL